jgi:hypothetical protein
MNLRQVGLGFARTSKAGNKFIGLTFAPDFLEIAHKEDVLSKLCIFKKTSKAGKEYYSITCPMPDNYECNIEFKKKEESQNEPF